MVSSTRAPNIHRTRLIQLLTLWSLMLWAQRGQCATTTTVILPSASALTLTHASTGPATRRLLRPVTSIKRSLQANTTTNTTAIDPVLAAQWKLLLAFREANVKCGSGFIDDWPTKVPTKPNGWPGVTVKNNRIVSVDFNSLGLCSDDVLTIWAKFPDLTHLDISLNNLDLKTLPASWSVLTGLTYLNVRAYVPDVEYAHDDAFEYMYYDTPISNNTYVSALPSEWSSLTGLTELVLDGWTVQGKLPSSWAALKSLKALTLPVGGLNGPGLPPAWGRLTALTRLNVPGVISWPNNSANVPGQTLLPKAWSGMRSLRVFDTPCDNLIGKPAQNGIPIAPYVTSLSTLCGGIDGCGAAVRVTQLIPLTQMTNLVDLAVDGGTVKYDDPKCLPPKGAFTLPTQWSRLKKLNRLTLKRFAIPGVRWGDYHLRSIEFDVIVPSEWSALTNLQSLDIDLSGWARGYAASPPESFSSLKALTSLSLQGAYYNRYYEFDTPANIMDALAKLRTGWTLPSSWGTLTRLKTLTLDMYGMLNMQLPDSYSALTNLTEVYLTGNCLQGTLPSSWGALKKLSTLSLPDIDLDVYNNSLCRHTPLLTGPLPNGWSGLVSLTQIYFSSLSLSGTIPSSWNRLTALQELHLTGNRLKGPLPSSWSTMNKLSSLELSGNKLNGTLPSSWGKLKSIETLDLSSNRFSGQPPESWGSLSTLSSLNLGNNRLSGTIPATWWAIYQNSAQKLTDPERWTCQKDGKCYLAFNLNLSHNLLKGPIPACLNDKLLYWNVNLDLSYNKLSGPLPTTPFQIASLAASHNYISGPLPATWSSIFKVNIYGLDLSYNRISGALPLSWGKAAADNQPHFVYLSNNKLTGTIPKAYENFMLLQLADNQLTGPVVLPKWAVSGESLDVIEWPDLNWNLCGNRLSGPLPINVKLPGRGILKYARNNLSGTLPAQWFVLPTDGTPSVVAELDLSHNSFSGGVPATWAALAFLNVSHNHLNGTLPKKWGGPVPAGDGERLKAVLDLSHNQLNGALPAAMYGVKHLDVHDNKLSGWVPPAGSNWVKSGFWDALQYVDLAANSFTGKKPTKPKSAVFFNTNRNKFSG